MDILDLRDWLLLLGIAFIVGVMLHGLLRMRRNRGGIKMKLDKSFLSKPGAANDIDDLAMLKAELPNGGARAIPNPDYNPDALETEMAGEKPAGEKPVNEKTINEKPVNEKTVSEKTINEKTINEKLGDAPPETATETTFDAATETAMPDAPSIDTVPDATSDPAPETTSAPTFETATETTLPDSPTTASPIKTTLPEKPTAPDTTHDKFPRYDASGRMVVLHVLAKSEPFAGARLIEVLLESGMNRGDRNIFHHADESGARLFSLANIVDPRAFDMAQIKTFRTEGVTLFMAADEVANPIKGLERMMDLADALATALGGEVVDESRSALTPEALEALRQLAQDAARRHIDDN